MNNLVEKLQIISPCTYKCIEKYALYVLAALPLLWLGLYVGKSCTTMKICESFE